MPDVRTLYQQFRVMGIPRGEALNGNGNGHHLDADGDPVAAAILRQRAATATRIDDGTTRLLETQADLDRRKLEVEASKLELEEAATQAKLASIRADLRRLGEENAAAGRASADPGLQALLQFVQANQEQSKADREALYALLNEQLEASRNQPAPEPPASPSVAEQIQQLVALRTAMGELFPPPPPPAGGVNPHQLIELRKLELDVEFQRARLAEESRDRAAQAAQLERAALATLDVQRARVQADVDRNQQMAALIERLGPAALAALSARFGGGEPAVGGPAQAPSPAAGGGGEQDLRELACPSCGDPFLARPGTTVAACPHCHQYLDLRAAWGSPG